MMGSVRSLGLGSLARGLLLCAWTCACGGTDVIADVLGDAGPAAEADASAPAATAGSGSAGQPDAGGSADAMEHAAWCSGEGGLWVVHGDGQAGYGCARALAVRSF